MKTVKAELQAAHDFEIEKMLATITSKNRFNPLLVDIVDIYVRNARAIRRTLYNCLGLIDSDEMEAMRKSLAQAYAKTEQSLAGRTLDEITGH